MHRETCPFRAGAVGTVTDPLDRDLGTSMPSTKHICAATTTGWEFLDPLQLIGYGV